MESLVRLAILAFELVEAEGRVLRQNLMKLALAMAIAVVLFVLALVGLGFLLYGLFEFAARPLTPAGAATLFGVVSLVLAGLGAVGIRHMLRGDHEPAIQQRS